MVEHMEQKKEEAVLKRLHLKITPRRLEVMRCLGAQQSYLSAEEVRDLVRPKLGSIGLPTVYRILDELVEAGVITRIFRPDRKQYFFLCANQEHHHHFVCESCRRVEDVDQCGMEGLTSEISRSLGGRVLSHIIQINGVCGDCSGQGGGAPL